MEQSPTHHGGALTYQPEGGSGAITFADLDASRVLFEGLARVWREETLYTSLVSKAIQHPAYRAVVLLGMVAVPYILADLKSENPGHWFPALHEITHADPVKDGHAGNVRLVADDWIEWGRQKGLVA